MAVGRSTDLAMCCVRPVGALYCRYDVYQSFMSGYNGGVYMGRSGSSDQKLGGHAVACYGFGTTSDGTPYWNCTRTHRRD